MSRSLLASEGTREALREHAQRSAGLRPSLMSFAAGRAAHANIANIRALPAKETTQDLQDSAGNFYFIPDYSDPKGPDVHRT